jgi:hypothetical protein
MPSSKKIATCVYLSKTQNPIPPTHTVDVYTYSHKEGGGGGNVEPERKLEEQQFTKLGRKTRLTDYISSL